MKLVEENVLIQSSTEKVWAFLVDPANMPLWNPKVKRVSPASFADHPGQGYRYSITYQMRERARASEFLAEFVRFEPHSRLVIRLTGGRSPHTVIEESYDLSKRDGGTFLRQSIVIDNSGINIFFRLLIRLLQHFGKPVGRRYPETLRNIIQNKI